METQIMTENEPQWSNVLDRLNKLIQFAYVIGSAVFMLGVWVATQQLTDQHQWEAIRKQEQENNEMAKLLTSTEKLLTRIDERTEAMEEKITELKEDAKSQRNARE